MVSERELSQAIVRVDGRMQRTDLARDPSEGGGIASTVPTCVERVEILKGIEAHIGTVIIGSWLDFGRVEMRFEPELMFDDQILIPETGRLLEAEMAKERGRGIEATARKDRNLRRRHIDNLSDPPLACRCASRLSLTVGL